LFIRTQIELFDGSESSGGDVVVTPAFCRWHSSTFLQD